MSKTHTITTDAELMELVRSAEEPPAAHAASLERQCERHGLAEDHTVRGTLRFYHANRERLESLQADLAFAKKACKRAWERVQKATVEGPDLFSQPAPPPKQEARETVVEARLLPYEDEASLDEDDMELAARCSDEGVAAAHRGALRESPYDADSAEDEAWLSGYDQGAVDVLRAQPEEGPEAEDDNIHIAVGPQGTEAFRLGYQHFLEGHGCVNEDDDEYADGFWRAVADVADYRTEAEREQFSAGLKRLDEQPRAYLRGAISALRNDDKNPYTKASCRERWDAGHQTIVESGLYAMWELAPEAQEVVEQ